MAEIRNINAEMLGRATAFAAKASEERLDKDWEVAEGILRKIREVA